MLNLEAAISNPLLPRLEGVTAHQEWVNCAKEYPWYALPHLVLSKSSEGALVQKASLWFNDPQRLHLILHAVAPSDDKWLRQALETELSETDISIGYQDYTEHVGDDEVDRIASETREEPKLEAILTPDKKAEPGVAIHTLETIIEPIEGVPVTEEVYEESADNLETSPSGDSPPLNTASNITSATTVTGKSNQEEGKVAEPLAFEPFHSVDYFASQGIKLDLNAAPKNKFDRQLMSFTQWLKTMKQVNVPEPSTTADPLVEAQANQSNSNKEVITEAMALVLVKQGKHEKATDIYQKLILLHPEKSVFFAAQIEELKNKR